MALSHLITNAIGHDNVKLSSKDLSDMASTQKYSPKKFDALLEAVAESYRLGGGQILIDDQSMRYHSLNNSSSSSSASLKIL